MDEFVEYHLKLDDLPNHLRDELRKYLINNYSDGVVTIIWSPLEILGTFPPELQSKILRSKTETRPTSLLTTKDIKRYGDEEYYNTECQLPITMPELIDELNNTRSGDLRNVLAIKRYEDGSINFEMLYNDDNDDGEENMIKGLLSVSSGSYEGDNIISVEHNLYHSSHYTINIFQINMEGGIIMIDPFTEYRIKQRRLSCINYNSNYAREYLIKWYNEVVAPDIGDDINLEDFNDIVIINYLAERISRYLDTKYEEESGEEDDMVDISHREIRIIKGEYDLSNQPALKAVIIPIFEESRIALRDYIISLTKVKYDSDSKILYL